MFMYRYMHKYIECYIIQMFAEKNIYIMKIMQHDNKKKEKQYNNNTE